MTRQTRERLFAILRDTVLGVGFVLIFLIVNRIQTALGG